jgi:hypothetical protein
VAGKSELPSLSARQALRRPEAVRTHFGVGRISSKGPGSEVLTYTVQRRSELMEIIIPFFEKYPLKVKASDFRVFCEIVRLIDAG